MLWKGTELQEIDDPELWASTIVRSLGTLLLVGKGQSINEVNDLILSLVKHEVFLGHLIQMEEACSVIVLKALSVLKPGCVDQNVLSEQVQEALAKIENKLTPGCVICDDLLDCHDADEEEIFFEVLIDDNARANLQKKCLQDLLEKWGEVEIGLFRQIAA